MTLHDERCFLEAIAVSPGDAALHLIYSDWLLERGREQECAWERWRARLACRPLDPALREKYAQWLLEAGQGGVARTHFWIARILQHPEKYDAVVARSGTRARAGLTRRPRDQAAQKQLVAQARAALDREGDSHVVIVGTDLWGDGDLDPDDDLPPGDPRRSPVLFLSTDDGSVSRVRPQQTSADADSHPYRCPFCGWETPEDDPSYLLSNPCRHFCSGFLFDDGPPYGAAAGPLEAINDLALSSIARQAERVALAVGGRDGLDLSGMPERFRQLFWHFKEGPMEDGESPYSEDEMGRAITSYLSSACHEAAPALSFTRATAKGMLGCDSEYVWSVNPRHTLQVLRGVIRRDRHFLQTLLASAKKGKKQGGTRP